MLLLVLILVLIAFGLLVVALLSGSVLWAWVSVGVSVAAAAVLLADWLQRRSAVKAGTEAGDAVPTPPAAPVPPPHELSREPVVEPATEIIPVVRSDSSYAAVSPDGAGGGRDDERADNRETVVMHPFAPSGSSRGPSGALDGIGASGAISSQNVTGGGGEPPGADHLSGAQDAREGDRRDAMSPDGDPDSETVKVLGAPGRDPAAREDVPGAVGVPSRGPEMPAAPPHGAVPQGQPLQGQPPQGQPLQNQPLQNQPLQNQPAAARSDLPPLGPDGAPPEEPRDADAAGLVAELNDEVLVVDELPRYHLGGCRSLAGTAVIPLPAREAVELGFTPCAWCTPDRTLSSRHRAPAR